MKHLFLPYELSLKLKEKGFNEPCFGFYLHEDVMGLGKTGDLILRTGDKKELIQAPIFQQAQEWFIKEHEIYILPFIQFERKSPYDDDHKEQIDNIYFIFNLKELRKTGENILPYIQVLPPFYHSNANWRGNIVAAIEEALKQI